MSHCLKKSGGTMTGSLILANAPSTNMEAATKAYVDLVYGHFKNDRIIGDENNAIYLDSANYNTSLLTTSSAKIELKHGKYKTTGSSAELTEEDPEKLTIYSNGYINSNSKIISFGEYNHGGQDSIHIDSSTAHILRNIATPESYYDAATKDYVDGKISDTKIILNSSTSGSIKKFEITVDDSGSLTATEVTTTA